MIFLVILILTTTAIAGAAAFFSVYGLAYTFSGTFWSVVFMGSSLEAGKLVAASFLYRYWKTTHLMLKSYLMLGVVALMILTSTGIFGYLSTGYQTDVLPLKQLQSQIELLEQEKVQKISRKQQIDTQIAQLPTENVRGRERLIRQFREEQKEVTSRVNSLDKEILDVKSQLIKTEAHIGPITFIAKAFNMPSDDATKYLILLIIFAFDPMAVALTLAVNNVIQLREREADKQAIEPKVTVEQDDPPLLVEETQVVEPVADIPVEPVADAPVEPVADIPAVEPPRPFLEDLNQAFADNTEQPRYTPRKWEATQTISSPEKIQELITHYRYLKAKNVLSSDETQDFSTIEQILKRHGLISDNG